MSEEVVQLAEASALSFRAFGSLELKGFSAPTPVFEAVRR